MAMIVKKAMEEENYSEDTQHLGDNYFDSPGCINPISSSTVMSNKVKARKLVMFIDVTSGGDLSESKYRPTPIHAYCRLPDDERPSFFDSFMDRIGREGQEVEEWGCDSMAGKKKRRLLWNLGAGAGLDWGFKGMFVHLKA